MYTDVDGQCGKLVTVIVRLYHTDRRRLCTWRGDTLLLMTVIQPTLLSFLPPLHPEKNTRDKSKRFLQVRSPSHFQNKLCRSTERNRKRWRQPQKITHHWPLPFFIHHHTPNERGVTAFMLALHYQYNWLIHHDWHTTPQSSQWVD